MSKLNHSSLAEKIDQLKDKAGLEFTKLGYNRNKLSYDFSVDARYLGQGYELRMPFKPEEIQKDPDFLSQGL